MNGGSPVPKRKGEKKMYGTVGRKHVIKPNICSGGRTVLLTQTKNRFNCHSLRFAGIISTSLTMSQHRRIKIVKDGKNNNNKIIIIQSLRIDVAPSGRHLTVYYIIQLFFSQYPPLIRANTGAYRWFNYVAQHRIPSLPPFFFYAAQLY